MRRAYSRTAEETLRALGFVSKEASLYVSHEALALRVAQRSRNADSLTKALATNDIGESFPSSISLQKAPALLQFDEPS